MRANIRTDLRRFPSRQDFTEAMLPIVVENVPIIEGRQPVNVNCKEACTLTEDMRKDPP